jgi:hypothetical protein
LISSNKDWKGDKLQKEKRGYDQVAVPDSHRPFNTSNDGMREATQWINELTGGSEYRSGAVDLSAAEIQHLLEFAGGGAARFVFNTADTLEAMVDSDKEVVSWKVPFARKVHGQVGEYHHRERYYELREELKPWKKELKSLSEIERMRFKKKHPTETELVKRLDSADRKLRRLRKERKRVAGDKVQEARVMREMGSVYRGFNGGARELRGEE